MTAPAPLMTAIPLSNLSAPFHFCYPIIDMQAMAGIIGLVEAFGPQGYTGSINYDTDNVWEFELVGPDATQTAHIGDWMLFTNLPTGITVTLFSNSDFAAAYSVVGAIPFTWDATTTAPVATALAGGQASLVFPVPTSANGPFVYAPTLTSTSGHTGPATRASDDVIADGVVTMTLGLLIAGDQINFNVVTATPYVGVGGTSVPSNWITAVS